MEVTWVRESAARFSIRKTIAMVSGGARLAILEEVVYD